MAESAIHTAMSTASCEICPVHGVGMLTPLSRLTYGMEITLDNKGLQLLMKHTGLPPENLVARMNVRPAIGMYVVVLEEMTDYEQRQHILEHCYSDHMKYREPEPEPPVTQRTTSETTKTALDCSWWDLEHKDHQRDRVQGAEQRCFDEIYCHVTNKITR